MQISIRILMTNTLPMKVLMKTLKMMTVTKNKINEMKGNDKSF
jgi:hypothetical protein